MTRTPYATHLGILAASLVAAACGPSGPTGSNLTLAGDDQVLLVAMSEFGTADDGSPQPLPARLSVLSSGASGWHERSWSDAASNVFHKALAYRDETSGLSGVVTLGGTEAVVKLWGTDGMTHTLWEADFGGEFSRMRDAEIGDLYGDGRPALAVATHDQGVVSVLRPKATGGFEIIELDAEPETFVHEIEIGDLDGDGVLEVYATRSVPNAVDGSPQPGSVVRYVPARDEGRTLAADLGDRHAKEILVSDLDDDGRDELYVAVEAVSGGQVEIRRYEAQTPPDAGETIATLDARLCRFLTAGDVDGDGRRELVAATYRGGIWLLRPGGDPWQAELITDDSSSFEHASILLDLDGDGRDELYVASDNQLELRRYDWQADGWTHTVLVDHAGDPPRLTWNVTAAPRDVLPPE